MDDLIYHSLTILNGINVLRGHSLELGLPYFFSWLFFNKFQIVVIGVIQWLSYFQPSLHFKGWMIFLIIPAFYGVYSLIKSPNIKVVYLLITLVVSALPGGLFYPERLPIFVFLGLLFWIILAIYGILKVIKK